MLVTSDDLWSGALREAGRVEVSPTGKFWIQALLWLAQREGKGRDDDPLLMARSEKSYYAPGETVLIQAQLRKTKVEGDPVGSVKGEAQSGPTVISTLDLPAPDAQGRASLEWKPPHEGPFSVVLSAQQGGEKSTVECRFTVGRPFRELERKGLDEDLLREIARQSGGAYFYLAGGGRGSPRRCRSARPARRGSWRKICSIRRRFF